MYTLMIIFCTTPDGTPTSQTKDFATKDEADAVADSLRQRADRVAGYLTVFKLYEV